MSAKRISPFSPKLFAVGNNRPPVKTVPIEPISSGLANVISAARLGIFGLLTTSSNPKEGNVHNINSRRNGFNAT